MLSVRPARVVGWLLLVMTLAYFTLLAPYGLNLDDEGTLLYQIYRTAVGQVLYVDFHAGYTPGIFWFNTVLFRLFGTNVMVLRLALAVVNSTTVLLLYLLARRIGVRPAAASAGALMYVALIPYYDGQFFAANIPYPIWYVTLAWLASLLAALRAWWLGKSVWWFATGLCSGAVFAFKPNSGLLCLAGLLIALVILESPQDERASEPAAAQRVLPILIRWGIPLLLLSGLTNLFAAAGWREVMLFMAPLLLLVGFLLWQPLSLARAVTTRRLLLDLSLLGGGFAAFNLPWMLYYSYQLGGRAFLRAILFVGTGFDKFYYIAYPAPSSWALLTIAALALVVGVGALTRARIVPRALVIPTAAVGLVVALLYLYTHPPQMVEGLQRAVVSRIRDIAFLLVLAVEWGAVIAAMIVWQRFRRPVRRDLHDADSPLRVRQGGTLVITLLGAMLMHMQLYPRTDYMHLVPASPAILVLGAWLLDRSGKVWALGLGRRLRSVRWLQFATTLPIYALILVLLMPALRRIDYLLRAWLKHDAAALVYLDPERAPLVIEPAASRLFDSLRLTAQYVRNHTQPQQAVFGFPVLDLVCFLSERHNPTRHGYFFPGWPGHAVEAEVINSLRQEPPAYVVTLHDHSFFFATAPIYYFDLRQFVLQNYRLERRIGMFDVLQPASATASSVPAPLDTELIAIWRAELAYRAGATARRLEKGLGSVAQTSSENLATLLHQLDGKAQRQLIGLIRKSRSDVGAAALALGVENNDFGPAVRELAVRVVAEIGNVDTIPALLRALLQAEEPERSSLAGLLYTVASKLALENYWYGIPANRELSRIADYVPPERLIAWMEDISESIALRSFAVRLTAALGYRDAVPALARLLGDADDWSEMRVQAADALVALGHSDIVLPAIVNLLRFDSLVAPGLIAAHYPERRAEARSALLVWLADADPRVRSTATWVAAAVRDPDLTGVFSAALQDAVIEVRMAAAWGLAEIDTPRSLQALQAALRDSNDEVAQFARRLMQRRAGTT